MSRSSSNLLQSSEVSDFLISFIMQEYKKPIFTNTFFINKDYLKSVSKLIDMSKSNTWDMRPERFAYDYYKEANIWPVLLTVNNISSRFNFVVDKLKNHIIYAPEISALEKLAHAF